MTLDIAKYLKNLIKKEAKVSHFTVDVAAGKTSDLKEDVAHSIREQNGESFLQDADYILMCTRTEGWKADDIKKMFDLTNRALGKDANTMSQSDFKTLRSVKKATDDEEGMEDEEAEDVSIEPTLFMKITVK